jgi:hypothetical protein
MDIRSLVESRLYGEDGDCAVEVGDTIELDGGISGTISSINEEDCTAVVDGEDGQSYEVDIEDMMTEDNIDKEDAELVEAMAKAGRVVRGGKVVMVKAHTIKKLTPAEKAARRKAGARRRGKKLRSSTLRARNLSMKKAANL